MSLQQWIVVNTETGHNKFWMLNPDSLAPDSRYTVRNGRLGTLGQVQKPLMYYEGHRKLNEKVKDGYREVTAREYERLATQAAIVGTLNKCNILQWVEEQVGEDARHYKVVADDLLCDPAYDPKLLVHIDTKKEVDGRTAHWLLFTPEASYFLPSCYRGTGGDYVASRPLTPGSDLLKLAHKVEGAMGRLLSG